MKPRIVLAWVAAIAVLLLVFSVYLRPDMAVTLANQLWSCF